MENLIVPEIIEIQLTDFLNRPLRIEFVTVYIKTKARHKNDFKLGPFYSNENGIIWISKTDFIREVNANYDSGLMDYSNIETNYPEVEIKLYTEVEINRMLDSRTKVWTSLLNGEKDRWKSIEELIDTLKKSTNRLLEIDNNKNGVMAVFNQETDQYKLNLKIKTKPNST